MNDSFQTIKEVELKERYEPYILKMFSDFYTLPAGIKKAKGYSKALKMKVNRARQ